MSVSKTTPMIKQYLSIKEKYSDAILFYRMGDFYEMFFEDAELASRLLEITLTSRNKKDESPIPMCGVPHKSGIQSRNMRSNRRSGPGKGFGEKGCGPGGYTGDDR